MFRSRLVHYLSKTPPENACRKALRAVDERIQRRAPLHEVLQALDSAKTPVWKHLRHELGDSSAAAALTLKTLNLLLMKSHFQGRDSRVVARPPALIVDPSNGCNLACPGCVHSARVKSFGVFDWESGLQTPERFAKLLSRYGPYTTTVLFSNYGEPTIHPNTPELARMAKGYYIHTGLSTNLAVKRFDAEAYVRSRLDFMFLSIDGASQDVYARYRKNGDLAVVYRNLENLVEAKCRLGSQTPILRWQFLAFDHNKHEIELARQMAEKFGVNQFVVGTPFDVSWDDPGVCPAADVAPLSVELVPDTETLMGTSYDQCVTETAAQDIWREFARPWAAGPALRDNDVSAPDAKAELPCSWLYTSMTVDANGRVLPCCCAPRLGFELVFGDLEDENGDWFNSEHYMQARRSFADRRGYETIRASGAPSPHCANCEWDQRHSAFGREEFAQYLRTASRATIDVDSIALCTQW